jgi:hypothetical protein
LVLQGQHYYSEVSLFVVVWHCCTISSSTNPFSLSLSSADEMLQSKILCGSRKRD